METKSKYALRHKPFKKVVFFVDGNHNKVKINIELTHRNKYDEFTMIGDAANSLGQCQDSIKPANKPQTELLKMWNKHHLKDVGKIPAIEKTVDSLIKEIIQLEDERRGDDIQYNDDSELIQYIENNTDFEGRDAYLCAAFVKMFSLSENDLGDITIDDNLSTVQGIDYIAGSDSEMDDEWDKDLESYIDECILPDVPETAQRYFDRDSWKEDAKVDGRGHSLNRYDGGEDSAQVDGVTYYAYRN